MFSLEVKMLSWKLHKIAILAFGLFMFTILVVGVNHAARIDIDTIDFAYLFDEGDGNTARDLSKNNNHGTITGATYVKGVFGTALEFDGVDDMILSDNYKGVGGTEPRTTVFWFKANAAIDHSWVKWGQNTGGRKYYIRAHPSGNQCFLRVEVNGGQSYGSDDVCDGEWHHCAVVFPEGSDSVKDHVLYVDGKLQNSPQGTDKEMDTNGEFVQINIGSRLTGHKFVSGLMDEIAVFNVALSQSDINAIHKTGLQTALNVDPKEKLATSWAEIKSY